MSKKATPEKGMRTVSIEFAGKMRTLKFTHAAVGDFEADGNRILRQLEIIKDGMIFADGLMQNWLGNARIMSYALMHGLAHDEVLMLADINNGIDSYIDAGGSMLELRRAILTAYNYATNPSTVASLMRSWKISDDRADVLQRAEIEMMESQEKAIADAKAKQINGTHSIDLPSSNLV